MGGKSMLRAERERGGELRIFFWGGGGGEGSTNSVEDRQNGNLGAVVP